MKEKVDCLLANAIVLTMDESYNQYEPGAVAIRGAYIVAVGSEQRILGEYEGDEIIDCRGKILMPGLINGHTHISMNLLRGLADDLRLDVWLMGYMMPVERAFVSPDFVRLGAKLAVAELIRSGVTCLNDMYYFEDDVAEAVAETGMRAICGQTVLKFPSPDAQSYEESLNYAREFIRRWKGHPLIVPAIAPHSAYTCTPEILDASAQLALEFDIPLHIHISETAQEAENMRKEAGMPVVPYLKKQNIFEPKTIAAHCVHIDEGEMQTMRHRNVGVVHNPSSNLKLASGAAPVARMLELGLNIGIGTDSSASNNDLDMFEEMRLASFLAKVTTGDPTVLPAKTVLSMGTCLGAKAIHLDDIIGSLEVGKKADLILVDLNKPHTIPRFYRHSDNLYAQLIYAGKSTDVSDVMVDGKWLMRDCRLLTIEEKELELQANEIAKRIDHFLIEREGSLLSKLVAIEGVVEEESFEVQAKVGLVNPAPVLEAIENSSLEILYHRHYHQYDTYFHFADPSQGYIRYREDEFADVKDKIINTRYRLTFIGPAREDRFPSDVLLSRSRYLAPATHSCRFYREYFGPSGETYIEKERQRWRVLYKGTEFYVNLDHVIQPPMGYFLEVKSRTWSRRDAENKAQLCTELIRVLLGGEPEHMVTEDYLELVSRAER